MTKTKKYPTGRDESIAHDIDCMKMGTRCECAKDVKLNPLDALLLICGELLDSIENSEPQEDMEHSALIGHGGAACDNGCNHDVRDVRHDLISRARAAIAKAEGK